MDQAGAPADFKFKHHRPVDIEKIKTSKYYSGPIQRAQLANLTVSTPPEYSVLSGRELFLFLQICSWFLMEASNHGLDLHGGTLGLSRCKIQSEPVHDLILALHFCCQLV